MRPWCTTLLIAGLLALLGCGDDDESESEPEATVPATTAAKATGGSNPARSPACRAVARAEVERAVAGAGGPADRLERSANDSLDLSICEYRETRGAELFVRVTIDTASKTARRYYNLIAEARQRATFEHVPDSTRPVGVRGVGNDRAHGGIGAYWTRFGSQLTAVDDGKLVKVTFNVPGADQESSRAAAADLARSTFGS